MPSKMVLSTTSKSIIFLFCVGRRGTFTVFMKIEIGSFKDLFQIVPRIQIFEAISPVSPHQHSVIQQTRMCDTILGD